MAESQPRRIRWHHIYFLLAAFDVATIVGTLALSHATMDIFRVSVDANSTLARRMEYYAGLREIASEANAPGNDVFESGDVPSERARLTAARDSFLEKTRTEREILRHTPELSDPALLNQLPIIDEALSSMVGEAQSIFRCIEENQRVAAGQHMNAMDNHFYDLSFKIAELEQMVRSRQFEMLQDQTARAQELSKFERFIGATVILIVIAVSLYGRKVSRMMEQSEARDRESLAQLKQSRKELSEALVAADKANRAKSQFLANMSHEIRTPMTAILGYAENLQDEAIDPEERSSALRTILRNGDHLMMVINDILDVSKIEAGELTVENIETPLLELLSELEDLFAGKARRKSLTFSATTVGDFPEVMFTDPTRLKQILVNLVGNALKFTKEGGAQVVASLSPNPEGAAERGRSPLMTFDVIDSGIGMPQESADDIFRPFAQVDDSMTRRFGGTGLGLSISRYLARKLGGDIVVTSEPGVGSTFSVTVSVGEPTSETKVLRRRGTKSRREYDLDCDILVAEDNPDNQRLIQRLLEKSKARVTVVDNGQKAVDEALRAAREGTPYAVILMDMQMPVMDGVTATLSLRGQGYDGAIIALTAHAMATEKTRCLEAGCNDFTTKPLQVKQLLDLIEHHKNRVTA